MHASKIFLMPFRTFISLTSTVVRFALQNLLSDHVYQSFGDSVEFLIIWLVKICPHMSMNVSSKFYFFLDIKSW